MNYIDLANVLAEAFELMTDRRNLEARQKMLPVVKILNDQLFDATRRSKIIRPAYQRLYLTQSDFLYVLRAPSFSQTSLSSVTVLGWNKWFEDKGDRRTFLGWLVRNAKQYSPRDLEPNPIAIKAIACLTSFVTTKLSDPSDRRLLLTVPSSHDSTNGLPVGVAKLMVEVSGPRLELVPAHVVTRTTQIGQIKNIPSLDGRLQSIKGSMTADSSVVQDRSVLIVDDVLESGASLREVARALRRAGASDVRALTFETTRRFSQEIMNKPCQ